MQPAAYRVTHLLQDLGRVDFDFICSTVCPVLFGLMGIGQKWLCKMVKHPNQSQPNPGLRADESRCTFKSMIIRGSRNIVVQLISRLAMTAS